MAIIVPIIGITIGDTSTSAASTSAAASTDSSSSSSVTSSSSSTSLSSSSDSASSSTATSSLSSSSSSSPLPSSSSSSLSSSSSSSSSSTSSSSSSSASSSQSSATSSVPLSSSSTSTSSSASASASATPTSSGISSLARSLIIAGVVVGSVIAVILAVGFLLRRRRSRKRDRSRTLELDGLGDTPQEKNYGDGRFAAALGREERPQGRGPQGGAGVGPAFYQSYNPSEISLQGPPMAVDSGGGGVAWSGGYDNVPYPPYAPQQQYPSQQQLYHAPVSEHQQFNAFSTSSLYLPNPPAVAPVQQQMHQQEASHNLDPYADPPQTEAQAAAGVGGDPSLGGALVAGGALDEEGVEMKVVRGFKATLDDELQITVFTMLRLHQTYDDGWCLCSDSGGNRGVVPRDCLVLPELLNLPVTPEKPRVLPPAPQLPSQSFSSSNLFETAQPSSSTQIYNPQPSADDSHPLASGPTDGPQLPAYQELGRPMSFVDTKSTYQAVVTPAPTPALATASSQHAELGYSLNAPRARDTVTSLSPSMMSERRSSLMDAARAAGAYLEGQHAA